MPTRWWAAAPSSLSRGVVRGELPSDIDADLLVEAFLAPIYLRVLFSQEPVSAEFLESLIDLLLDGVLTVPPALHSAPSTD